MELSIHMLVSFPCAVRSANVIADCQWRFTASY